MRTLTYYVAASLDGFIAGPAGEVDAFSFEGELRDVITSELPETLPVHARAALGIGDAPNRRFDTVVMGRGTYQPAIDAGIASPYPHLEQVVVSSTLVVDDPAVTVTDDPVATVTALKEREGLGIWLAGGGRLAGALADHVDELVVKRNPVLLGAGVPLFDAPYGAPAFRRVGTRVLDGGVVIESYRRG